VDTDLAPLIISKEEVSERKKKIVLKNQLGII